MDSCLPSSQPESELDQIFSSDQIVPSSPPSIISEVESCRKPKRPPPVTPRSFRRFFTPRSSLATPSNGEGIRTNRRALQEITGPALNRTGTSLPKPSGATESKLFSKPANLTPTKKRKFTSTFDNPLSSSPLRRVRVAPPIHEEREEDEAKVAEDFLIEHNTQIKTPSPRKQKAHEKPSPVLPIQRSTVLQTSGALFARSLCDHPSRKVTIRTSNYGASWLDETANFYSSSDDVHSCINQNRDHMTLPFCTTACNTNTLVAIGDEEGGVRLVESAKDDKPGFSQSFLSFRPHTNAIMDLEFSSDDKLLATASGDQTAQIIDMPTQKSIYCLSNHTSSVKRVRFQPGNNDNVIATCSRDGSVSIWDLRCKGFEKPSLQLRCSLDSDTSDISNSSSAKLKYPQVFNSINDAHAGGPLQSKGGESNRAELRRNGLSVTSLAFLPAGRENLFVTGSEANACVKLWDLRTAYNVRRGRALPLSTTRQPESHDKHRVYGVTSLTFGGDGSRLYSSCRDGTIYAYSTSHLMLGHSPEMAPDSKHRRSGGPDKEGLGPLYGFRHPRFQVTTFYVKAALRPAANGKGEMLAVGSSDHCAVLFPTDERYLNASPEEDKTPDTPSRRPVTRLSARQNQDQGRPGITRTPSGLGASARLQDTIPIYHSGTALVEGHEKEVSSLTWTTEGELVTVSDDFHARCWREGAAEARELRTCGDAEGKRWRCGWADVPSSYDDDDV
ncbi:hypothetical protein FQN54_003247 [Arachnomyces sp. PD_36]|nr:hypothetical protein FQN54_003247 [Arachnomyces sp. PD_36]